MPVLEPAPEPVPPASPAAPSAPRPRRRRHAAGTREAVADLARAGSLTLVEIAARTGVSHSTVCLWNQRYGWRGPALRGLLPRRWSPARRAAAARLFGGANDPGDVAEALGAPRGRAQALARACGLPGRPPATEGPELRAALRAHVARQIADLDARLMRGDRDPDSGRVLRDLGGLKRLLDDLDETEVQGPPEPTPGDLEDAAAGTRDLAALRARIAARYARFARLSAGP